MSPCTKRSGPIPQRWPFEGQWYSVAELAAMKGAPAPTLQSRLKRFQVRGSAVLAAHLAMYVRRKPYKKRVLEYHLWRADDELDMTPHRRLNEIWRPHNMRRRRG